MPEESIGEVIATRAAATEAAVALGVGAKGLEMTTAKATLYIRMLSLDNSIPGATINEDVAALASLTKQRKKSGKMIAKRVGKPADQLEIQKKAVEIKTVEAETTASMMAKGFVPMDVQYNPASLSMQTMGGPIQKYTAMGNDAPNSLVSTDKKTSTYLTVQLVFEDISISDAFGSASMENGVGGLSNAVDIAKTSIMQNKYGQFSVRTAVEGIFSLLMLKRTRQVIFVWADMFFHGELLSVDANYTMFNKKGNPLRAVVNLEIQQTNINAAFQSDLQYWNEVLDQVFTD